MKHHINDMKRRALHRFGGPECLKFAEVAKSEIGQDQVLVHIHAASVNPVDIKIREELSIGPELPAILGADLAGVVEAIGEGVTQLAISDEVYGCAGGVKGQGGTLAHTSLRTPVFWPPNRNPVLPQGCCLAMVLITPWEASERAAIKANQNVLVQGHLGGCRPARRPTRQARGRPGFDNALGKAHIR